MAQAETYDRILHAAHDLFVKNGYTASSMRQVAEAANIGKATIYHHFPDKQAIVLALVRQYLDRMGDTLDLVRVNDDPRSLLLAAAEASLGFLFESSDILSIVRREVPGGRDRVEEGLQAFFKDFAGLVSGGIRRGIEAGIFREVDPDKAARVFLTMLQGTFATVHLGGPRPASPRAAVEPLLEIFFLGINVR